MTQPDSIRVMVVDDHAVVRSGLRFFLLSCDDIELVAGDYLWTLDLAGEPKAQPFLQTPFLEYGGAFSPDGRWVLYVHHHQGRDALALVSIGGERWPQPYAVVPVAGIDVEQTRPVGLGDLVGDAVDDRPIAALTEVGNAFDQLHGSPPLGVFIG